MVASGDERSTSHDFAALSRGQNVAGIVHNGDADRCLAIDSDGQPLDGDQILAVLAARLKRSNQLIGDTVVVRECRPLSRIKRWRLVEVVQRA